LTLLALTMCAAGLLLGATYRAEAHPGPFHMDKLRAWINKERGLTWVHVEAQACVPSSAQAWKLVPSELRLTQFVVYNGRWNPTLIVTKPHPWIVSFGDAFQGKACGRIAYRDLFEWPEGFAGFDSAINCLGVEFSVKVGARRASKRTTVRCGQR
jgi:hypothetical protein